MDDALGVQDVVDRAVVLIEGGDEHDDVCHCQVLSVTHALAKNLAWATQCDELVVIDEADSIM